MLILVFWTKEKRLLSKTDEKKKNPARNGGTLNRRYHINDNNIVSFNKMKVNLKRINKYFYFLFQKRAMPMKEECEEGNSIRIRIESEGRRRLRFFFSSLTQEGRLSLSFFQKEKEREQGDVFPFLCRMTDLVARFSFCFAFPFRKRKEEMMLMGMIYSPRRRQHFLFSSFGKRQKK